MRSSSNHTQAPVTGPPSQSYAHRIQSNERRLSRLEERSIRIETRLMRLLEHHGLDGDGRPLRKEIA